MPSSAIRNVQLDTRPPATDTPIPATSPKTCSTRSKFAEEVFAIKSSTDTVGYQIFAWLIAFRLFNAFFVKTFFQPGVFNTTRLFGTSYMLTQKDEYFQSLEPAWQVVFGDESGAWITWEWRHRLRSTLYPYLFAAVYYVADRLAFFLGLSASSRADLLLAAPKFLQAFLAAIGDLYTWKLGVLIYGADTYGSWLSLFLPLLNPFHFFVATRTLSNCLELVLNTIALHMWFTWAPNESVHRGIRPADEDSCSDRLKCNTQTEDTLALRPDSNDLTVSQNTINRFWLGELSAEMSNRLRSSLILAAIACVLRVTNLVTWTILASFKFINYRASWVTLSQNRWLPISIPIFRPCVRPWKGLHRILLSEAILCGLAVLGISAALDHTFYKEWTFPPLQFLHFNIREGISEFYGVNDVSWYFLQALPLLLGVFLPFAMQAIFRCWVDSLHAGRAYSPPIKTEIAAIAFFVPIVFSFVAHKEVRFIYPLLPVFHLLAAGPVANFFGPILMHTSSVGKKGVTIRRYSVLYGILLVNFSATIAVSRYHQRASLSVMDFLRHEHEAYYLSQPPTATGLALADSTMTVGFLMPCHSTPWRSHLIYPSIKGWALGCEPPIGLTKSERKHYRDEADLFYDDPVGFLQDVLGEVESINDHVQGREIWKHEGGEIPMAWDGKAGQKMWPNYLVFFAEKEKVLEQVLENTSYTQCWRGWNSWLHDDWRRRGDIVVWCDEQKIPSHLRSRS